MQVARRMNAAASTIGIVETPARAVSKKPSFLSKFRRVPLSVKETQEISVLEQFQKLSKDLEFMPIDNNHPLHDIATKLRGRKYLSSEDSVKLGIQNVHDEKIIEEVSR
jgi:hypothetical protein